MKFRRFATAIAGIALVASGIAFSAPAQAATIQVTDAVSCTGATGYTSKIITANPGDTLVFAIGAGCNEASVEKTLVASDASIDSNLSVGDGTTVWRLPSGAPGAVLTKFEVTLTSSPRVPGLIARIDMTLLGKGTQWEVRLASGGSGGSTGTSSSAFPAPVEVSLSLDLAASGASCTGGSDVSGTVGTWMSLPGADTCTSTATPNAKLLGWATKADFPVEIAQRQIDNSWGAYELFNDEGQMTAVFIPAGGATFVSASTSLHPIWAS